MEIALNLDESKELYNMYFDMTQKLETEMIDRLEEAEQSLQEYFKAGNFKTKMLDDKLGDYAIKANELYLMFSLMQEYIADVTLTMETVDRLIAEKLLNMELAKSDCSPGIKEAAASDKEGVIDVIAEQIKDQREGEA